MNCSDFLKRETFKSNHNTDLLLNDVNLKIIIYLSFAN
jgi:hypothetical protein